MPDFCRLVDKNCGNRCFLQAFATRGRHRKKRDLEKPQVEALRHIMVTQEGAEDRRKITDFRKFCPQEADFLATAQNPQAENPKAADHDCIGPGHMQRRAECAAPRWTCGGKVDAWRQSGARENTPPLPRGGESAECRVIILT